MSPTQTAYSNWQLHRCCCHQPHVRLQEYQFHGHAPMVSAMPRVPGSIQILLGVRVQQQSRLPHQTSPRHLPRNETSIQYFILTLLKSLAFLQGCVVPHGTTWTEEIETRRVEISRHGQPIIYLAIYLTPLPWISSMVYSRKILSNYLSQLHFNLHWLNLIIISYTSTISRSFSKMKKKLKYHQLINVIFVTRYHFVTYLALVFMHQFFICHTRRWNVFPGRRVNTNIKLDSCLFWPWNITRNSRSKFKYFCLQNIILTRQNKSENDEKWQHPCPFTYHVLW